LRDYGKVYASADEALAGIPDGVVMAAHTWGFCGTPHHLFAAIMRSNIKDITLLCPNFMPFGALEKYLPGPTSLLPKLKKVRRALAARGQWARTTRVFSTIM